MVLFGAIVALYLITQSNKGLGLPILAENAAENTFDSAPSHANELLGSKYPARQIRSAWVPVSQTSEPRISHPENLPIDAAFVKLNDSYSNWLLGTPIDIQIPQIDKTYQAIVDRIEPDSFNNITIYAEPADKEEEFVRLILTYNRTNTREYIATQRRGL